MRLAVWYAVASVAFVLAYVFVATGLRECQDGWRASAARRSATREAGNLPGSRATQTETVALSVARGRRTSQ